MKNNYECDIVGEHDHLVAGKTFGCEKGQPTPVQKEELYHQPNCRGCRGLYLAGESLGGNCTCIPQTSSGEKCCCGGIWPDLKYHSPDRCSDEAPLPSPSSESWDLVDFKLRLDNAIKYNFTGGFEKHFLVDYLEDFIKNTIIPAEVERCKQIAIQTLSSMPREDRSVEYFIQALSKALTP